MGEIKQSLEIGQPKNWYRVNAMFDSGATSSYLKASVAKKVNAPKYQNVSTVLGDNSQIPGYLSQINIKIGNRIGLLNVVVVPNLDGELLIGQDFMQMNDVVLHMKKEKFMFGSGQPKIIKVYKR